MHLCTLSTGLHHLTHLLACLADSLCCRAAVQLRGQALALRSSSSEPSQACLPVAALDSVCSQLEHLARKLMPGGRLLPGLLVSACILSSPMHPNRGLSGHLLSA